MVRADIPQGVPGEQAVEEGLIVEDEIAREFLPATRITDLDQISGKVALNNLAANQVLVDGMFVDPATSPIGFAQRLEDNHVAVSVSVSGDQRRVEPAGPRRPGQHLRRLPSRSEDAAESTETSYADARLLYHQVRILAIGTHSRTTAR